MRPIKFRAWHKTAREMLFEDNPGDALVWSREQPVIVEQWTGLFDRHGKEIFEHDIVEMSGEAEWGGVDERGSMTVVTYDMTVGQFNLEGEDFLSASFMDLHEPRVRIAYHRFEYLEVVGNIHENPELAPWFVMAW